MRFDSSFHHSWKKCIEPYSQSLLFTRLSDEILKHLKSVRLVETGGQVVVLKGSIFTLSPGQKAPLIIFFKHIPNVAMNGNCGRTMWDPSAGKGCVCVIFPVGTLEIKALSARVLE